MEQDRKVALVTGGGRGIGRAVSKRLAKDGFFVIINYRENTVEAQATLDAIRADGGDGELCKFDVTDRVATETAIAEIIKNHSEALHTLVFNAGIRRDTLLIFMPREQWDEVLNTNLLSFFTVVKPVVKQLLLNKTGRVIVMSSTSGETGIPGQVNYSAAKAGLIGAVKALALECAKRNVLVNAVTPGFIATDMTEEINTKEMAARVPIGRFGKPEEVASAVSFLASQDATYITGQTIRVNGGMYL